MRAPGLAPDDPHYLAIAEAGSPEAVQLRLATSLRETLGRDIVVDLAGCEEWYAKDIAVSAVHWSRLHPENTLLRSIKVGFVPNSGEPGKVVVAVTNQGGDIVISRSAVGLPGAADWLRVRVAEVTDHELAHVEEFDAHIANGGYFLLPNLLLGDRACLRWFHNSVIPDKRPVPAELAAVNERAVSDELGAHAAKNKVELYASAKARLTRKGADAAALVRAVVPDDRKYGKRTEVIAAAPGYAACLRDLTRRRTEARTAAKSAVAPASRAYDKNTRFHRAQADLGPSEGDRPGESRASGSPGEGPVANASYALLASDALSVGFSPAHHIASPRTDPAEPLPRAPSDGLRSEVCGRVTPRTSPADGRGLDMRGPGRGRDR
ncbi:hypothetical protein LO772_32065 [Yinghuangia sp. ASG 101]|uniref:hypothetical protein n=1 Tax=Yinghuangia sp. ASG 101 TaxID=2896848 RepID=UPI001E308C66|nr:hypothetical protein [Yinghuangia sp. ASG 101]UGQ11378.1 hypothetical protein LO772_32065 [Yinghuangia sp. ASG 101]